MPGPTPTQNDATPKTAGIPPQFLEEFRAKTAQITREAVDEKLKELQEKAIKGELPMGPDRTAPKLKNQDFYDRFDPLKGKAAAFGQFVKVHLIAAKSGKAISDVARELESAGKLDGFVSKALVEGSFADGGSTVAPEIMAGFIELLRAALVLKQLGMGILPMAKNELLWNRQNAAATATYRGELVAILSSQLKTGMLKLQARELNALTIVSNNLLNDGGPLIDMMVRDDIVAVMALRCDLAGIRGDGANDTPKGLRYLCDQTSNVVASTQADTTPTFQEIDADFAKLFRRVKAVNGVIRKPGIIITPTVEEALLNVSTQFGVYPYRDQMLSQGKIRNAPYVTTSQVPDNLGDDGDESEVYLADFAEFYMGENEDFSIESSREATVTDLDGTSINAFQQGVTAIKSTARHDFGLRHKEKAAVLTGVKWGSALS